MRVHQILAGVPLHDVWCIELPHWRAGLTLDDFRRATGDRLFTPSGTTRVLLGIRFFVGRIFGWDREPVAAASEAFATRLTPADRSRSLTAAGEQIGIFSVVYRFENEELLEIINRTAHGAALAALFETESVYRFYFAVYVRSVSWFTPIYMALIAPVRKLIVYPVLLSSVRAKWDRAFAEA